MDEAILKHLVYQYGMISALGSAIKLMTRGASLGDRVALRNELVNLAKDVPDSPPRPFSDPEEILESLAFDENFLAGFSDTINGLFPDDS